jgi:hypothetical protein
MYTRWESVHAVTSVADKSERKSERNGSEKEPKNVHAYVRSPSDAAPERPILN